MIHEKNFPFHKPDDETEIIHVDHEPHHKTGIVGKILIFLVIAVLIGLSAKALFEMGRGGVTNGDIPVIEAIPDPYKSVPENPGGMEIPHIDKEIYNHIKMPMEQSIDSDEPRNDSVKKLIDKEHLSIENETPTPIPQMKKADSVEGPIEPKTIRMTSKGPKVVSTSIAPENVSKSRKIDVEKILANKEVNEIWLQLGSFKSEQDATKAWQDAREKNGDLLKDMTVKVTKSDMKDQGIFYRLQAGPADDESDAKSTCVKLNERKQNCFYTSTKVTN